jgi:5'-deoxynucleotidase YfbR-like HD superfamily hydrolase
MIPVAPKSQLYALTHDAPEYALCDVPRPIKSSLVGYKTIEENMMDAMLKRWNIPYSNEIADCVKVADDLMLVYERKHLINAHSARWGFEGVDISFLEGKFDDIMGMTMTEAKNAYISKFVELRAPNQFHGVFSYANF